MFTNIQLFNPDFLIDCSTLENSSNAYQLMRINGIRKSYVYGMCYKTSPLMYDFLKVGKSSPNLGEDREYQVGERVARQISWVTGWSTIPSSSHGIDFWLGIQNTLIPTGKIKSTFNRNDLVVAVWDISKRMALADILESDEPKAAGWAEGELAAQYKKIYKRLPLLNIQDPSNSSAYKKPYILKSVWNANFV